jgi:hypothetical protein
MAANITASFVSSGGGPEFMRSPRGRELVKLQGSGTAANDTSNTYTCQNIQKPAFVEGGSQILSSIVGNQIVFTTLVALGNNAVYVWVDEAI